MTEAESHDGKFAYAAAWCERCNDVTAHRRPAKAPRVHERCVQCEETVASLVSTGDKVVWSDRFGACVVELDDLKEALCDAGYASDMEDGAAMAEFVRALAYGAESWRAERDRWAKRVKELEARLAKVVAAAEGRSA